MKRTRKVAVINGHPDGAPERFCSAVAETCAAEAERAGLQVRRVDVASLDIPFLGSKLEWDRGDTPDHLRGVQNDLIWADHWIIIYPLWMGDMPAKLKALLEQTLRPGLSYVGDRPLNNWQVLLSGTSARVIVTMAMPAVVYRTFFKAHSVKSLERNILRYIGLSPVRTTLVGSIETRGRTSLQGVLRKVGALARKAA